MADKDNNMLVIDESTEVQEESLGSRMQPGIHENVVLTKIEYVVPNKEGAKWTEALDFTFGATGQTIDKDQNGNVLRDTANQPVIISRSGDVAATRQFYDPSDEKKSGNTLMRIKHIMTKFMTPDEARVKGTSFKILSQEVIKLLKGKTEGVKLRLKIIKASSGYGEIPGYTPFVERMDTGKPTNLKLSTKEREGQAPAPLADLETGIDQPIAIPGVD